MKPDLFVGVEPGVLVIRIPIDTLAWAANHGPLNNGEVPMFRVTDNALFAGSVALALEREDEDGSTPVTRMFDAAFERAIEDCDSGVELLDKHGNPEAD